MRFNGQITHYDPKVGFGKLKASDGYTYTFNDSSKSWKVGEKVTFLVSEHFVYSRVAYNIKSVK